MFIWMRFGHLYKGITDRILLFSSPARSVQHHNAHILMQELPVISIITVTFRAESLLEGTIQSVLAQDYPAIEFIIVDGGSTDGTLEIARKYQSKIAKLISEPDKGIYDAMNKGIQLATGEYVVFMNAGDSFYNNQVLSKAMSAHPNADFYYGDTMIVNEDGQELGRRRLPLPEKLNWKSLQMGMMVSHQSMIARRSLAVPYDLQYKISADIDWTIRVLKQSKTVVNTNQYVSRFLEGGTSAKRRKQGLKERWAIQVKHYGLLTTVVNHAAILVRYIWHKLSRKSMT